MKQKKILVVLSSQVSEENSSFVFIAYAYVARVNQALIVIIISDIRGALFVQLIFRIIRSVLKSCQNEMQMKV